MYAVRSHKTKSAEIIEPPVPKDQRQSFTRMSLLKNLRWQYVMLCLPVIIAFAYLVKFSNSPTQPISNPIAPNKIALESTLIKAPASLPTPIISYKNQDKTNHGLMPNETLETVPMKKALSLALLNNKQLDNRQLDEKNLNKQGLENKKEMLEKNAESNLKITDALKAKSGNKTAKKKSQTKAQIETLAETDPVQTYIQHKVVEAKPVVAKTHPSMQAQQGEVNAENTQSKTGWKTFTDSVKQGQERKCSQVEITMNQCH